ncbi:hypothetical protein EH223_12680 [candidate division KSB1 bacterium]|nr:hypothetical protein [candidate division KSB1 bacterium]RQW02340.1 MAG: hypothetical protein EH223_12680 [candidate division KSB1 bacterium]
MAPTSEFKRQELRKSRSEFTIDGVQGDKLGFRADIPSGKWWLTCWIEAGKEDSSTMHLFLDDEEIRLQWHPFREPAEPRKNIQGIYRILHVPFDVKDGHFEFILHGNNDVVRLLGFSLTPDPVVKTDSHKAMASIIERAGTFNSRENLIDLNNLIAAKVKTDPNDPFYQYWHQQIQLLAEAEILLNYMGWEWAYEKTGLSIFSRYHQAVMILDGLLNRPDVETCPLYERALWMRAKLLYWLGEERHGMHEIAGAQRDFTILRKKYPDDQLLAMYTGEKIKSVSFCDNLLNIDGAPAWSRSQFEALCRMREIAHWWVNERQAENGEFGGKIGDDVELLRWWSSLILAGDQTALRGWKKLADEVWKNPKVYKGYSKYALDVEHASEFISDTAPLMVLYSDDPVYEERLSYSADYFQSLWTGYTIYGNRLFKSAWFGSQSVDMDPPKNRDLEYNTRALKAVRFLLWKSGNPKVLKTMHEYAKTWVRAAMDTAKSKPPGLIPGSIRFPDEAINGDEPTWYKANMYWDYFDWTAHTGSMMLDQLLFTFKMTQDSTLLEPIDKTLQFIKTYDFVSEHHSRYKTGSAEWAVSHLKNESAFWQVVSQWRLMTSDNRYDDLLLKYGTDYLRFRLTGDESFLVHGCKPVLESVSYNRPLLTSEVLVTDRVYIRGADHLKAMLTGDGVQESSSPYFAVSYQDTRETMTALVKESSTTKLHVQFFSYEHKTYPVKLRVWQLDPGDYLMTIQNKVEETTRSIRINSKGERIVFDLAQLLCDVIIKKM